MKDISIEYHFQLEDNTAITFPVVLHGETLQLLENQDIEYPEWALLSYQRCPNCPHSFRHVQYCPVAASLSGMVSKFEALLSFDMVVLTVCSEEREIKQKTTIQRAIASYMGLVMATCGCPRTLFLKPMARHHLPLASESETIYRAFSMYALAQCFIRMEQNKADENFEGLQQKYTELQVVNKAFVERLRAASKSDSSVNALLNLDVYARAMPYVIEDSLDEIRHLFEPYLTPVNG